MSDKGENTGGGFFGRLKSLVVEEDPRRPADTAPSAAVAVVARPSPVVPVRTAAVSAVGTVVDPRIKEKFEKALAAFPACNTFRVVLKSMTHLPDERVRVQTALVVIKAQGYELPTILKEAGDCLEAVDAEERAFAATAAKQIQDRIGNREENVQKNVARIEALRQEIAGLEADVSREQTEIVAARAGIDEMQRCFTDTAASYKAELTGIKQKISQGTGG